MNTDDPGLYETCKDFYETPPKSPTDRSQARTARVKLIELAWCYNQVASLGTTTSLKDSAKKICWPTYDDERLKAKSLELRLLFKT